MTRRFSQGRRSTVRLATGALLGAWLTCHGAEAAGVKVSDATPAQIRDALKHFKAGGAAVAKHNLTHAIVEYRASLDIIDSPNSRLELARALRDNDQSVDAWTEYSRTIEDGQALAANEARYEKTVDAATLERRAVEAKIALLFITVEGAPPGATLQVGSVAVPSESWGKPFPVAAVAHGAVEVMLQARGAVVARQTVQAEPGGQAAVTLGKKELAPVAVAPQPEPIEAAPHSEFEAVTPAGTEPPHASRSSATRLRPFAYAAGGVGLAGLATFAISGSLSHSAFNNLQSKCHGACPPGHESEISSGRTEQTVANVGLVLGALGVASGVGLFIMSLPHARQGDTALVIGPAWLGVRGSL